MSGRERSRSRSRERPVRRSRSRSRSRGGGHGRDAPRGGGGGRGPHAPPPPPPPRAAPHVAPPPRIDREKTCPLLLRVFPKLGGHHRPEDFPARGPLPSSEFQIYTWPDATLRELADLVRAVPPALSRPYARLAFSLVYPDRNGRAMTRPIGQVLPAGRRGEDDGKSLHGVNFQTGDYLNVAILG